MGKYQAPGPPISPYIQYLIPCRGGAAPFIACSARIQARVIIPTNTHGIPIGHCADKSRPTECFGHVVGKAHGAQAVPSTLTPPGPDGQVGEGTQGPCI